MRRTICLNNMNMYRAILTSIYEKNRPLQLFSMKMYRTIIDVFDRKRSRPLQFSSMKMYRALS